MAEMRFEEALTALEKLVQELESENLSLEKAVQKYEEGIHLLDICVKEIQVSEMKITQLTKKKDELTQTLQLIEEPFRKDDEA